MKNKIKKMWKDPRTGEIYTKLPKGEYLKNGLHKKFLEPYSGEKALVKKMKKPQNTVEVVVDKKPKVLKSQDKE